MPQEPRAREHATVIRDAAPGKRYVLETDAETHVRLGRVRQRGTKPELLVRRALRGLGHHFRTTGRGLPGSPDLVNRRRAFAIFVHGCFWHGHEGCRRATVPKRNREFWIAKLERNRERDREAEAELRARGLRVLVVWQCEAEDPGRLEALLRAFMDTVPPASPRRALPSRAGGETSAGRRGRR